MVTALKRRTALAWAALMSCGGCAAAAPADSGSGADAAREFRALRAVRGHFDGGAWNDAVDRWQGRKHVLMQQLAQALLRERATSAQIRERLGAPDAVVDARNATQAALVERIRGAATAPPAWPTTPPEAIWLYRWRGTRDQMALALWGDRVLATAWLYEWE